MKRIIKGISVLMCFALVTVIFAGCGNSKKVTISELFTDKSIWYYCLAENSYYFDKDTGVDTAYLINGDKIKVLNVNDKKTLGDFANMDDSEIEQEIVNAYDDKIKEVLNSYGRSVSPLLANYSNYNLSSELEDIKSRYLDNNSDGEAFNDYDESSGIDKNEFMERNNAQYVRSNFREIFYDKETDIENSYLECDYKSKKYIVPIETVRKELNAFYEKYPAIKCGIEAVVSGEEAKTVAENIINETLKQIEETEECKQIKAEGEKILKENDGYKYKLALVSDGTGNKANQEGIIYQKFNLKYEEGNVVTEYSKETVAIADEDYWNYFANGMSTAYATENYQNEDGNCIQVYDTYYGGLAIFDNGGALALCTKSKKNCNVVLDEIDAKKFIIDPTPDVMETLFVNE